MLRGRQRGHFVVPYITVSAILEISPNQVAQVRQQGKANKHVGLIITLSSSQGVNYEGCNSISRSRNELSKLSASLEMAQVSSKSKPLASIDGVSFHKSNTTFGSLDEP